MMCTLGGLASIQQVRVTKLLIRQHHVSLPLINAYMQYIKQHTPVLLHTVHVHV